LRVYPTTVGFPVVPEVVWMRITCFNGTAKNPNRARLLLF
jgi:hypothetical protein